MAEPDLKLFGRLGIRAERSPDGEVVLRPYPQVCAKGVVRPSVLALVVDMMGGFVAEAGTGTDWIFTSDLSLRAPARHVPGEVVATGRALRTGRGIVSTDVEMREGGEVFAYGQAGFSRVPRRHGDPPHPHLHENRLRGELPPLERPLVEEVGVRVLDPSRGSVEVEMTDALRNPAGAMQGAIVALVAEVSAESLADHGRGSAQIVTDLDVRYLAMGREGPVTGSAEWIGPPEAGALRVELRDRGLGNRLMTSALARVAPAPEPA